jgi:ATP-dependent DNA ligase
MLQHTLPAGFIAPCLPRSKTTKLPSGSQWLHEIKHDGFRIIARKTGAQVRLYSRPGNDLKDSLYRSGRSRDWLKMKNPAAPAVKREEGEDWSR